MWFVTGMVLVYHSFPRVTSEQKYEKSEILSSSLPEIHTVLNRIPASDSVQEIYLRQFQDQTLYSVSTGRGQYVLCKDSLEKVKPLTFGVIEKIARKWCAAPVLRVDTLHTLEQWIMYSSYKAKLPVYKFYFGDKEKHQLYISARTGEVQQWSDAGQRFWAWIGAIPHKFYFFALRQNVAVWRITITTAAAIALVACLTGLYAGIDVFCRRYRQKRRWESPYKNAWYRWHHWSGVIFGFFLTTWAISGVVCMKKLPQWIARTHREYKITPATLQATCLPLDKYVLDYRSVRSAYPDLKEMTWSHYQDVPVYDIVAGNRRILLDASAGRIQELFLSEKAVGQAIKAIHGDSTDFCITLSDRYDNYYLSVGKTLPLPVYKVQVGDEDRSRYYIDPRSGKCKYLNYNRQVRKWFFSAPHYLYIKFLVDRPVLWFCTMWFLVLGCLVVVVSGIRLGIRFCRRKTGGLCF